ncbi:MAG: HRDC domain-containing protein [Candidatus Riflebacteria bacterium]|nr:HRDC domain-containing protein [Candidatus Riflebacteria bacterium]
MTSFDSRKLLRNARVVETNEDLVEFLDTIKASEVIAVDIESAGFFKYYFRVNLIQIATRDVAAVLDPQSITDFSPLVEFSKKNDKEWVFHGCEFDARVLIRDFNLSFSRIFDSLHAAEILGLPEIGLSSLCEKYFGFGLNKKLQKCDWSKRPLTDQMLEYCLLDAIMLIPIREIMIGSLESIGRLNWAREEFEYLSKVRCLEPDQPHNRGYRIKGSSLLPPKCRLVLKEVWELREEIAKQADKAPFMLLQNEALIEIARKAPRSIKGLSTIKSISPSFVQKYGEELRLAVKRGLENDISTLAEPEKHHPLPLDIHKLSAWEGEITKKLKETRDQIAQNLKIAPNILASGDTLSIISHERPQSIETLSSIGQLRKWQAELLGNSFLEILKVEPPPRVAKKRGKSTFRKR